MLYVISDLHGYPLEDFKALLRRAKFSDDDFLYILGDVIDRNGDGGVKLLQWIMEQPNVELILGNHEAMLLSCSFLFEEITDASVAALGKEKLGLMKNYMANGGEVTLTELNLLKHDDPDALNDILDFLRESPAYAMEEAGGKDYILVHSGLDNFSKDKKLSEYTIDELTWAQPSADTEYFDDVTVVFGHRPTFLYGAEHDGKIMKTATWINIDAGAGYDRDPVLLRLDDMCELR